MRNGNRDYSRSVCIVNNLSYIFKKMVFLFTVFLHEFESLNVKRTALCVGVWLYVQCIFALYCFAILFG